MSHIREWHDNVECMRVVDHVKQTCCKGCLAEGQCPILAHSDDAIPIDWLVMREQGTITSATCRVAL